jgi:aminopeptidase N
MKNKLLLWGTLLCMLNGFAFSQNTLESKYDVKQYILDLQISNSSTLISGNVTINASVTAAILDTFVVDLIDTLVAGQTYMVVDSVFVNGALNTFQHHDKLVYVPLIPTIPQNQAFSVQIYYHGNGLVCNQTNNHGISLTNYCGISQSYSWSEPRWSKVWWPCKQVLMDKADSVTFYITTDSTNKSGSNGLLKATNPLPGGKVKNQWVSKYPIDFYLVSFAVGPMEEYITYALLPSGQDSVLLQSLLFAGSPLYQQHIKAISKTKQMIYLYSELLGDYPFKNEKYGYCLSGHNGAMENQTMCTISWALMDTIGTSSMWWTAHELSHQWFGDYVTCATWNHSWLNEGFASYMEYVAFQYIVSQNKADIWINYAHTNVKSHPGGSVYVADSLITNDNYIFDDRLVYKKGASILHTLRYEINNDSLFFAVLKNYLSAYAYSVASTEDFKLIAETTTGMDFTEFFNQWFYGEGYPTFNINWSQANDTLTILSNQTTSTTTSTLFKTHFDVKINYATGDTILRLYQGSNNETYKIYLPVTATSIIIDPNFWLIQKNFINVGIEENNVPLAFSIFPNPATDKINIDCQDKQCLNLSVYNIVGELVLQRELDGNTNEVDIRSLAKGVYIIKVSGADWTVQEKLVKE